MVSTKMSAALLIMAVIMIAVSTKVAEGQPAASCASKLTDCAAFLNSTNPPSSTCCNSIRETVNTDLPCLCNLYANPAIFSAMGINITQALGISGRCGISSDVSACNASAPGASQPGSTPGARPGRPPGNGVGKIASTGLSSLLLLWPFLMLY